MEKRRLILVGILLIGLLTACGQQGSNPAVQEGNSTAQESSSSEPVEEGPSTGNASSEAEQVFKIGGIPDQDVSELNRRFTEFADVLGEATGLNVEYVPSQDYAALVTAFKRGEVHLAWFGGLTGVQARAEVPGSEAIAQRPSDEQFHSVFIAQKDLGVKELTDLKGLSFTFGSESSTSGHLMPRYYLMEAGIIPEEDFSTVNYSGSHDKTWKLIESGAFETGALNELVWQSTVDEDIVDLNKVDAFYTTPAYYDYNWTIHAEVDNLFGEGTKESVKAALLSMGEQHPEVLEFFQTDRFIETNNENYAAIESVAKELGIIK